MNIDIVDGKISFSITDLLDKMTSEQKKEIIDSLSCEEDIITLLGQQITEGFTDMMSRGSRSAYASSNPKYGLDKVMRDIAKASSAIAKEEIESLEHSLSACQERESDLLNEMWNNRESVF